MYKDFGITTSNNGLVQNDYKSFRSVTNEEAIKNSVKNIILTSKGTVPGKPNFGSNIYNIIFELATPLTLSMASNYVYEALAEFENRINVLDVNINFIEEYNRITIDVQYEYVNNVGILSIATAIVAINV